MTAKDQEAAAAEPPGSVRTARERDRRGAASRAGGAREPGSSRRPDIVGRERTERWPARRREGSMPRGRLSEAGSGQDQIRELERFAQLCLRHLELLRIAVSATKRRPRLEDVVARLPELRRGELVLRTRHLQAPDRLLQG